MNSDKKETPCEEHASALQRLGEMVSEVNYIVRGVDGQNGLRGRLKTVETRVRAIDIKLWLIIVLLVGNGALSAKDLLMVFGG